MLNEKKLFFSFLISVKFSRQAVLIAGLVKTGVISEKNTWGFYTVKMVASGLQVRIRFSLFFICIYNIWIKLNLFKFL